MRSGLTAASITTLIVSSLSLIPGLVQSAPIDLFIADLDAHHVVPPTESLGTGHMDIQFEEQDSTLLRLTVSIRNLSGPVGDCRIHSGRPGQNGPVVFDVGTFDGAKTIEWRPTAQDVADLYSGSLYVEARGRDYPRDEIRGELHLLATVPCEICGPGAHWIHQPGCPQGTATAQSEFLIGTDFDFDCGVDGGALPLFGPASVLRSPPRDDSANYPGTRPIDGHLDVIDTEITSLSVSMDGWTLIAGAGLGDFRLAPSLGVVAESPADPSIANSFFDLFFEIRGGPAPVYNQTPLRIQADITCIPPRAMYGHPNGCMPLFTSPAPGQGEHVANLITTSLGTFLEPSAVQAPAWLGTDPPAILGPVVPNPVTGALRCAIDMRVAGHALVRIHDIGGRLVATLMDEELPAGLHDLSWGPSGDAGKRLARGVYTIRLDVRGAGQSRKFVVR